MQMSLFPEMSRPATFETRSSLELSLAIRRICARAAAEGKTEVRGATFRKLDHRISQLRRKTDQPALA